MARRRILINSDKDSLFSSVFRFEKPRSLLPLAFIGVNIQDNEIKNEVINGEVLSWVIQIDTSVKMDRWLTDQWLHWQVYNNSSMRFNQWMKMQIFKGFDRLDMGAIILGQKNDPIESREESLKNVIKKRDIKNTKPSVEHKDAKARAKKENLGTTHHASSDDGIIDSGENIFQKQPVDTNESMSVKTLNNQDHDSFLDDIFSATPVNNSKNNQSDELKEKAKRLLSGSF